mmetsp:Transcript_59225/g.105226  ORF Transcript_59225/g.105226 Transcript_59225/m.105226 type:complete len:365 (-) Transcript_59225:44-1138(-)|eukprot:CAMPEP_0197631034 /NCGR_PEP_ID=MMETSP1338-20131121/8338_1 /TAXON_ID=43686 ORGANISM="Pelagodinium beii, Strain RCC1491" /NCGR_SAMPLE_ID=MMETSP1338 /ASSEMBLY_ACC=CAM_ASM_000754 /LENGTH=364 /DNA_ID=CAMNT_0043202407 /DNA_START=91 /DNA_END=1185 /DNA_ORIENTATION=+
MVLLLLAAALALAVPAAGNGLRTRKAPPDNLDPDEYIGSLKEVQYDVCDCSACTGQRTNGGGDGGVSFQCFPSHDSDGECRQTGSAAEWVVQTAEILSYDRFCLYTCRPILRNRIEAKVPCKGLTHEEITLQAQSASFNGKEMVYKANPMTHVTPISKLVPMPGVAMLGVESSSPKSPQAMMKNAFAYIKKEEKEDGGLPSPYDLPPPAQAPPLCVCHCNNKGTVNRLRLTPKTANDPDWPKPPKISGPAAGMNPALDADPPEPPMPPPPPADLPPPSMPTGIGAVMGELPMLPEAPPEINAPLDLNLVEMVKKMEAAAPAPAPSAALAPAPAVGRLVGLAQQNAAVSFLQQASGGPIACNCIC